MPRPMLPRPPCQVCGGPTRTPQNRFCGRACSAASRSTTIERTCERCGKAFPFRPTPSALERGAGRFCSTDCANAAKRKHQRPPELPCVVCGDLFRTSGRPANTRYCSSRCAGRARTLRAQAVVGPACARCGRPCRLARQQYCSKACVGLALRRRISRVCPVCQQSYEVRLSDVKAGSGVRCSLACRGIARRRQLTVSCQRPGCPNTITLAQKAALRRRYCSSTCSALAPRLRFPRVSVRCPGCRKNVTAPAWRKRVYCSRTCADRIRHRQNRPVLAVRNLRILQLHALGLKAPTIAAMMVAENPAWDLAPPLIRKMISLGRR